MNVNESVIIDVRCNYQLTLQLAADAGSNESSTLMIDSVVFTPDYTTSRAYAGKSNQPVYLLICLKRLTYSVSEHITCSIHITVSSGRSVYFILCI